MWQGEGGSAVRVQAVLSLHVGTGEGNLPFKERMPVGEGVRDTPLSFAVWHKWTKSWDWCGRWERGAGWRNVSWCILLSLRGRFICFCTVFLRLSVSVLWSKACLDRQTWYSELWDAVRCQDICKNDVPACLGVWSHRATKRLCTTGCPQECTDPCAAVPACCKKIIWMNGFAASENGSKAECPCDRVLVHFLVCSVLFAECRLAR